MALLLGAVYRFSYLLTYFCRTTLGGRVVRHPSQQHTTMVCTRVARRCGSRRQLPAFRRDAVDQ